MRLEVRTDSRGLGPLYPFPSERQSSEAPNPFPCISKVLWRTHIPWTVPKLSTPNPSKKNGNAESPSSWKVSQSTSVLPPTQSSSSTEFRLSFSGLFQFQKTRKTDYRASPTPLKKKKFHCLTMLIVTFFF